MLNLCQETKLFQKHLEAVLNIIVFYAERSSANQKDIPYDEINEIVAVFFNRVYSYSKYDDYK